MLKKLFLALSILAVLSYFTYQWIASLPKITFDATVKVSARSGEQIFWGKGQCHACHRIGDRGYALRGPNLGESTDGAIIPKRAQQRASQSGLANGTAYLVQSIAAPGSFVVPGYNNEMPEVFKAPIFLSPPEIKSVVLYLESLSGDTSFKEIQLPAKLLASYQISEKKFEINGDFETGRSLFFDLEGPAACAACHLGMDAHGEAKGSTVGPDLTAIASFRTPEYILQKIIEPDSNIVSGYEEMLIKTNGGRMFVGRILEQSKEKITMLERDGNQTTLIIKDIRKQVPLKGSTMPSNYEELLTERQLDDLLSYLLTQLPVSRF